jgi:hypothetical protein
MASVLAVAYQDILTLWKDAANILILKEARLGSCAYGRAGSLSE